MCGGAAGTDSGHTGEILSLGWPENALVFPGQEVSADKNGWMDFIFQKQ